MTDRIALFLGLLILAAILADLLVIDSGAVLFLLRRLALLVEWLAFWR